MGSHTMQKVQDIKLQLDKVLSNPPYENEVEAVSDMLSRVAEFEMTPELIAKSGLGNTLASAREKLQFAPTVADKARDILLSWKAIMKKAKGAKEAAKTEGHAKEAPAVAKFNTEPAPPEPSASALAGRKSALPGERKAMVTVFQNIFKTSLGPPRSEQLALDIEEAINSLHPSSAEAKQYSAKAKTLAFNVQKNKHLRELLEAGHITPSGLTKLSASELASSELKHQREKLVEVGLEARRLDWLETHKHDIQVDIGVDPSNNWQYDHDEDGNSEPDADAPDA